jgi:hypothetical protein
LGLERRLVLAERHQHRRWRFYLLLYTSHTVRDEPLVSNIEAFGAISNLESKQLHITCTVNIYCTNGDHEGGIRMKRPSQEEVKPYPIHICKGVITPLDKLRFYKIHNRFVSVLFLPPETTISYHTIRNIHTYAATPYPPNRQPSAAKPHGREATGRLYARTKRAYAVLFST